MLKNKNNITNTMDQEQISQITNALRANPRGMTVTQISQEINLNRNSVAKYLEVLLISGHVEMKSYGPAKVFYMSQRVPMSAMLNFSSNYILILDRDLKIIQANEKMLNLIKTKKGKIIGQQIKDTPIPAFKTPEMALQIKDALNGQRTTQEIEVYVDNEKCFFIAKLISTTFEDGLPGVTIILENVTEIKNIEKKIQQTEMYCNILLQSINESIIILDHKWKIVLSNDATAKLFKTTKEKLQGNKITNVIADFENSQFFETCNQVMKTHKPVTVTSEYSFGEEQKTAYKMQVYPIQEVIMCITQKVMSS
ncbi:MAG: PAS domain-containing protein [Candidatus Bathyarchaeia archaeon]|jgi:PAS domain S-box-containing protein